MTDAVKHDAEKPYRPELFSFIWLQGVSGILADGAVKYAPNNWRKGMAWSRLIGSFFRHTISWTLGHDTDPDSGKHHLLHASCCLMFLYEYTVTNVGTDDRYKETK